MTSDPTFDPLSRYASDQLCAAMLGQSLRWFRKHEGQLLAAGFPEPDPITGLRAKADVDAWIAHRRKYRDTVAVSGGVDMEAF